MYPAAAGMFVPVQEDFGTPGCPPPLPRILIDLTTSWHWKGQHAVGIVRTEREIARRLLEDATLCALPVVYHERGFRLLTQSYARSLLVVQDKPAAPPPAPALTPPVPRGPLARVIRPFAVLARKGARLALKLPSRAVAEELRLSLVHARQAFRNLVYRAPPPPLTVPKALAVAVEEEAINLSLMVHPRAGDVLFVCGLSWDVLEWPIIAQMRRQTGLRIVSVMYDLIPIKHPEFVGGPQPVLQNCFLHMIDVSDLMFCISECTERDLAAFAADNGRPPLPTEIIHLGADVPARADARAIPEPARTRLAAGRFALTVGTFEIRKNYALLVDIWEALLKNPDFDLDLVIVGMTGWLVDDVVARLKALPGYGERIHWFNRLSDAGLSWLYETCHVFVFPSLYEGWGLPVAEALQHKSPSIVSNRGATPEAAFGQALLLDPDDRAGWKAALLAASRAPRRVVDFDLAEMPRWERTAQKVKQALLAVAAGQEARP